MWSFALFEHARFLANDFEGRADFPLCEHFGEALRGVRRRRMHGMKIRVVTDVMLLERSNYISSFALFEHARFLANDFEGRADFPLCEHFGEALRGVIVGW